MAQTKYPNLRRCVRNQHTLSDRMIERVVGAQGLEAQAIEGFWDDLGNVVSSALPVVGGAIGSIVAPGVGTAIGTGLGSAVGGALKGAIGPSAPAAAPVQTPATPQGFIQNLLGATPFGTPAAPTGSSQQMAALFMQMLTRPQTLQALMQMLLGSAGNPTVPVAAPAAAMATPTGALQAAPTAVPISAFTNMLSTLAGQVSEAYNAERAFTPSAAPFHYGANAFGSGVDLASPESRAAALAGMLSESDDGGAARMWNRTQRKARLAGLAQALRTAQPVRPLPTARLR